MSEHNPVILIVDDDQNIVKYLSSLMKVEGFKTLQAYDGKTALGLVQSEKPDVMLLDMKLPDMGGMEVLRQARDLDEYLPVIVVTGYSEARGATRAMKAGAFEYLGKPFESTEVVRVVTQGVAERKSRREVKELSGQLQAKIHLKELMGPSDIIARLISEVECVAGSDFSVVIFGETGSGKELVGRAIHEASNRSSRPFTPVDCGAIPETLLESELFGYEKGAFTGADIKKPGKFEISQGGTLFLDEVSNMPLGSQAKLLRVLQEKKVYSLGGTKSIDVDVRILVASNQDLHDLTASGSFRHDLFYRLNEFAISIPPLRERKEDIPYLAKRFLDTANFELRKSVNGFSESALNVLFNYNWPGNVRQLQSTIRRATLLAGDVITEKDLGLERVPVPGLAFTPKVEGMPWKGLTLHKIVQQGVSAIEREVIGQALRYTGGNKAKAARLLGIDYKTIHQKIKNLGLSKKATIDIGEAGDKSGNDGPQTESANLRKGTHELAEKNSLVGI